LTNKKWRPAKQPKSSQIIKVRDKLHHDKQIHERCIRVTSIITPVPRIRGGKVETLYEFNGLFLGQGSSTPIHCRIVRDNWAKKLCKATPGSVLQVKGYIHSFGPGVEFHITHGWISEEAHYVDGYKPTFHADGTWHWLSLKSASAPPIPTYAIAKRDRASSKSEG